MKKPYLLIITAILYLVLTGGMSLANDSDIEKIEALKQVVKINPNDALAHHNLGKAYDKLGMHKEAIDALKQAIRINPDYAKSHHNLGISYHQLGKHKEAIEALKQAIRTDPDYAKSHLILGIAYYKLGKIKEAIESYKQAIRINPDDAGVHLNLGNAYYKSGKDKEAIEALKQAIRINPDFVAAHFILGYAYVLSNDRDSALEQYKILKTLDTKLAKELFNDINEKNYREPTPPVTIRQKPSYGGTSITKLRSSHKMLSVSQVQSMSNVSILEKDYSGFYGHSTINHDYNLKTIYGDKVVIDHATGLMWHQSGSDESMDWNNAKYWVSLLNSSGYAGYHDWRLPTVEEASSLLESSKLFGEDGLYIDPVFSNKQQWIWTGDRHGTEGAWGVIFYNGLVRWIRTWSHYSGYGYCVRPVRSGE